jgi:hypothetical protein
MVEIKIQSEGYKKYKDSQNILALNSLLLKEKLMNIMQDEF